MARIIEARYYPHGLFLEAAKGSRPSATWSGIMKARHLLEKGIRVRIGNGYATEVWNGSWVRDDGHFKLFTPRPPNCYFPWKVADLIDPEAGTWNTQLIVATFWPIDRYRILSTPLGAINSGDRVVWHYSKADSSR